jgi:mandelate racemase
MTFETLTLKSVDVRPVLVPLKRPVVSRVGRFEEWPIVLIDVYTAEGIVGRSYLEPYLKHAVRSIVPAIRDLAAARAGKPIRPLDDFQSGRRSLNLVGYQGITMIAVAGLDMAAWDALAKAANMPLAVFLGGSLGPVPAYNSNGLWLVDVAALGDEAGALVAEGGFKALKLRLGRERLDDDLAAITTVRSAVGDHVKLMVDFNQGLTLGDAATRSTTRGSTGSRSRSPTTTSPATRSSRASSTRPCSSARTSMARAISRRPLRRVRAIT